MPLQGADDVDVLALLVADESVKALARGEAQIKLLWEVCSIPDFRKLLIDDHAALLREIYLQIGIHGEIDEAWLAEHVDALDDVLGDIDTLTARIAAIRIWTYVSHRETWLRKALGWQERTRQIEDRLSDALHEALVRRFVEKGQKPARKKKQPQDTHHPFAQLARFSTPEELPPLPEERSWTEELIDASHLHFSTNVHGKISFDEREVGLLIRGTKLLLPEVKIQGNDTLPGGVRLRIQRRLLAFARDDVAILLDPLRGPEIQRLSLPAEGIRLALEQSLGTIFTRNHGAALQALSQQDRIIFREMGVILGQRVIYVTSLLDPDAIIRRTALTRAFFDESPPCPPQGTASIPLAPSIPPERYLLVGYAPYSHRAVRADVVEHVVRAMKNKDSPGIEELALWMDCDSADVPWLIDAMNTR